MGARPGVSVGPAWCVYVAWCECGEGAKPGVWAWPGVNLVCGRGLMRVCVYMAWFGRGSGQVCGRGLVCVCVRGLVLAWCVGVAWRCCGLVWCGVWAWPSMGVGVAWCQCGHGPALGSPFTVVSRVISFFRRSRKMSRVPGSSLGRWSPRQQRQT